MQPNKWMLISLLAAPLLLPRAANAARPAGPPPLDPAVLQKFTTNSIEAFDLEPMLAEQKIRYSLALGALWLKKQNPEKAVPYFNLAVETAHKYGLKKEEGQSLFGSALLADMSGDLPGALGKIARAISLFKETKETELLRQALGCQAGLQHRRGMYADSLRTYRELLPLVDKPEDELMKAECLSEIAMLNYKLGSTNEVETCARQALKIYRDKDEPRGEAECLKILGNHAGGEGRTKDALDFYEQAAAKFKEAGDIHGQANCFYNLGCTLNQEKKYDQAITNLQDAVAAYTRSSSLTGVGIANMELGRAYFLKGDIPKAEATLELARSLLAKSQDLCRLAQAEGYLADLRAAQGRKADAIAHHQAALRLYEQAGLPDKAALEKKRLRKTQSLPEK